jgi:hypothetical protein
MPLIFYPHEDDLETSSLEEKLEVLLDASERYKAAILDAMTKTPVAVVDSSKRSVPKDTAVAFNWEEIARVLTEIRQLPEANAANKIAKADKLAKLAEIYEVLRAAKMPKLEAVRLALVNEAGQLRGSAGQAA